MYIYIYICIPQLEGAEGAGRALHPACGGAGARRGRLGDRSIISLNISVCIIIISSSSSRSSSSSSSSRL